MILVAGSSTTRLPTSLQGPGKEAQNEKAHNLRTYLAGRRDSGSRGPERRWQLPIRRMDAAVSRSRRGKVVLAAHSEPFDLLLGRRTYDIWSGFWPKAPSSPLADS